MSESQKFELTQPMAIVVAGALIAAAILATHFYQPQAVNAEPSGATVNVPAPTADEHIVGSPSAPVVLIEYSDFQCPYCSIIYPEIKNIVANSNGQVAWVMRNFPLYQIHPQAEPAANAAECIVEQLGNAAWWKYADAIFTDQSKLTPEYSTEVAKQLGVDVAKYNSCVSSKKYQAKIDAQSNEALGNGGQGTPYTVVWSKNYQQGISGALQQSVIESVIDSVKARH